MAAERIISRESIELYQRGCLRQRPDIIDPDTSASKYIYKQQNQLKFIEPLALFITM
jgi:hypothetical protein